MGTIAAVAPISAGLSGELGISAAIPIAAVVGGAMFGDNLSFISDTTIAAVRTQKTQMRDKFKTNFLIVLPAAMAMAAGKTIRKFVLNLSLICVFCVRTAAMVVSEIKERLSPNIAPPTTAAIGIAAEMPSSPLKPALIGATAAIVPIDCYLTGRNRSIKK